MGRWEGVCQLTCGGQRTTCRILDFHYVSPGNRTQVNKLGGRCLYLLSHPLHWPRHLSSQSIKTISRRKKSGRNPLRERLLFMGDVLGENLSQQSLRGLVTQAALSQLQPFQMPTTLWGGLRCKCCFNIFHCSASISIQSETFTCEYSCSRTQRVATEMLLEMPIPPGRPESVFSLYPEGS